MTFQQRLMIISALAGVLAVAVLGRNPGSTHSRSSAAPGGGLVAASLAVLAVALIMVGAVSQTLLRHVVQIAPLVVALGLLAGRSPWGVSAAAPLLAFWLLIMGAIWLFLMGVARIVSGTFTPVEVALTIVIGAASVLGLAAAFRRGARLALVPRLGVIAAFAVLQFGALWLSMHPAVAGR
jgi:hypothetical protein